MRISIVGNGNLAQNLSKIFFDKSHDIVDVYAQDYQTVLELSNKIGAKPLKNILELNTNIDFLIIAITDRSIESFLQQLPKGDYIILHTSGSISIDVFDKLNINNYGVFYPFYSFVKDRHVNFEFIPLMIESSNTDTANKVKELAESISSNVVEVNSENRKLYHLSGVMVNNFTNHFWTMAQELLKENSLDFKYLKPILEQISNNALEFSDLSKLQTGPARRNDFNVINMHLSMLESNPLLQSLYKKMTELIIEKYREDNI